jgi:cytochrome P450
MTDLTTIQSIDYFGDPELANDPYKFFEFSAANHPVYREPVRGVFMVSGYQEALDVFRDTETFSSANATNGPDLVFSEPFSGDDITDFVEAHRHELTFNDQLPSFDPPMHTAHRALLTGLITPKRLRENEEFMWRLADRQLDIVLPAGEMELIDDYAQPYTLLVVADLLGVPEEDHPALLARMGIKRSAAALGTVQTQPQERPQLEDSEDGRGHSALDVHYPYFIEKIADRRKNPVGDVLTGMAQATFPDGTLPTPLDCARIAANLFAAGQETTVRLLGGSLQRIADDPQIQRTLRDRRDLIPRFVEETLRFDGPVKGDFRLVRKKTTLAGVEMPAGSVVFLINGAANRDARQFENPGEFQVERPNARRHFGFGHGVHTCPGAPLARSEVRVTIERLFDRTNDIRIDEYSHGPRGHRSWNYMQTYMFRGLVDLHLEFDSK